MYLSATNLTFLHQLPNRLINVSKDCQPVCISPYEEYDLSTNHMTYQVRFTKLNILLMLIGNLLPIGNDHQINRKQKIVKNRFSLIYISNTKCLPCLIL